jgi:hypothetical protein
LRLEYIERRSFIFINRFTKNLSPDKINLSTLKGEGEMSNLELDEEILMELLDLPTWMRLKQAVCNKLSIKVSSTTFVPVFRLIPWDPMVVANYLLK